MLELLSLLRPLSTWQMLLGVCLLDLALIAMRLSRSDEAARSQQEMLQGHRLQELLVRHADLVRNVADSRRQLEEDRSHLETLMAVQAAQAEAEAEQLRLLTQGVEDVEQGVAALLAKHAGHSRSRQNATHTWVVT